MASRYELAELEAEAREIGVFLPLEYETASLDAKGQLHGRTVENRAVLLMQPVYDADETGAPTKATVARYCDAVRAKQYGLLWTEPIAVTPEARAHAHQLMLTEENASAFAALVQAVREASEAAHGSAPMQIALLGHAGADALTKVALEPMADAQEVTVLTDEALLLLAASCGSAAAYAEKAGFSGIALDAGDSSLFAVSLAAFHRDGRFGGDFDDRTRFLRDCYTAMHLAVKDAFLTIRLSLADGLPQPGGWGMGYENPDAPDLYEPTLLLEILRALYGVELVCCAVGTAPYHWMQAEKAEREIVRVSRLCTCIAMLDSNRQQNVQLIVPQTDASEIPFPHLAAGMIAGEFASYAGYTG